MLKNCPELCCEIVSCKPLSGLRPCLNGSVLDCLMRTSMWLGEWELGTTVVSVEVRWTEGSNGPLQVNSLDLKNPKKARGNAAQSIT